MIYNILCGVFIIVTFIFTLLRIGISFEKKRSEKLSCKSGSKTTRHKKNKKIKDIILKLFEGFKRFFLFILGYVPSHTIRHFIYKNIFLVNLEKDVVIYYGAEIRASYRLHIGKGSIIGDKAILDARNGIWIGENVNFSTGVWIWTEQHDYNSPDFGLDNKKEGVKIGDRVWVGPRVTILPNVIIGDGAVIAAGSVVTKDVEPYSLVGGVPAKKIGERVKELIYNFDGSHIYFL